MNIRRPLRFTNVLLQLISCTDRRRQIQGDGSISFLWFAYLLLLAQVRTHLTAGLGDVDVEQSAAGLYDLNSDHHLNNRFYSYTGQEIPWWGISQGMRLDYSFQNLLTEVSSSYFAHKERNWNGANTGTVGAGVVEDKGQLYI